MNRLFCSLEVYIHRQTHVPKVYWPITRSIWGSICFIPAYLTLIHFTAVWWLGIIKLITVGYSDCVSQCINSVAHLVSAASRCMGEVCQWILITCILLRIFQDINVTESQNHISFLSCTVCSHRGPVSFLHLITITIELFQCSFLWLNLLWLFPS